MFKTGSPVKGDDFIDRKKHIPLFKAYLENNQHIMIKGPRRYGKTSLVKHIFEGIGGYDFIYIDVKRASSLKQLSDQIIDKAYSLSGIDNFMHSIRISMYDLIKKVEAVKIGSIAEVTIKSVESNVDEVEFFLHSLDIVEKLASSRGGNIKIIFDEFQDILLIADKFILDKMRTVAQHHENVTYIFLGSVETIMTKIFEKKSSSFFHFTKIIPIEPLDIDEVTQYAKEAFAKLGIPMDDNLSLLIHFFDGHPDYTMQALQNYYLTAMVEGHRSISVGAMRKAAVQTIYDNKAYIDELISKAKTKKHHLAVLQSIANNESSNIDGKTLYNVRTSLEDMGLVRNVAQGKYVITDIILAIYLQQSNDESLMLDGNITGVSFAGAKIG